jgi:phosphoglycolate phosphatase
MRSAIFDLDGTLVDSAPSIVAAVNAALVTEGAEALGDAAVRAMIGHGVAALLRQAADAANLPRGETVQRRLTASFMAAYENTSHLTRLNPGLPEGLDRLEAEGWRLGLVTNKSEGPTRSTLRHVGLEGRFEAVLTGDTASRLKPDPAPLRAVQEALGGYPAVYVGDSEVDATAANAAALPFLLFTEGYRRGPVTALLHVASFSDFSVLPQLADDILKPRG